jgi:hypothetical protein
MGLWLENKFSQLKTDNNWTFWLETKFSQNIRQTQHNNYQQNDHNKQFSPRVRVQHSIEYVAKIIHMRVFFLHCCRIRKKIKLWNFPENKFSQLKTDNNWTFWLETKFSQLKTDNYGTFWLETTFWQSKADNYWTFWLETKFFTIKNLTTLGHFG